MTSPDPSAPTPTLTAQALAERLQQVPDLDRELRLARARRRDGDPSRDTDCEVLLVDVDVLTDGQLTYVQERMLAQARAATLWYVARMWPGGDALRPVTLRADDPLVDAALDLVPDAAQRDLQAALMAALLRPNGTTVAVTVGPGLLAALRHPLVPREPEMYDGVGGGLANALKGMPVPVTLRGTGRDVRVTFGNAVTARPTWPEPGVPERVVALKDLHVAATASGWTVTSERLPDVTLTVDRRVPPVWRSGLVGLAVTFEVVEPTGWVAACVVRDGRTVTRLGLTARDALRVALDELDL